MHYTSRWHCAHAQFVCMTLYASSTSICFVVGVQLYTALLDQPQLWGTAPPSAETEGPATQMDSVQELQRQRHRRWRPKRNRSMMTTKIQRTWTCLVRISTGWSETSEGSNLMIYCLYCLHSWFQGTFQNFTTSISFLWIGSSLAPLCSLSIGAMAVMARAGCHRGFAHAASGTGPQMQYVAEWAHLGARRTARHPQLHMMALRVPQPMKLKLFHHVAVALCDLWLTMCASTHQTWTFVWRLLLKSWNLLMLTLWLCKKWLTGSWTFWPCISQRSGTSWSNPFHMSKISLYMRPATSLACWSKSACRLWTPFHSAFPSLLWLAVCSTRSFVCQHG